MNGKDQLTFEEFQRQLIEEIHAVRKGGVQPGRRKVEPVNLVTMLISLVGVLGILWGIATYQNTIKHGVEQNTKFRVEIGAAHAETRSMVVDLHHEHRSLKALVEPVCAKVQGKNGRPPTLVTTDKFQDYRERAILAMDSHKKDNEAAQKANEAAQKRFAKEQDEIKKDVKEIKREVNKQGKDVIEIKTLLKQLVKQNGGSD